MKGVIDPACPLCDAAAIETSVIDHVLADPYMELRLKLIQRLLNCPLTLIF